MKYVINHVGFDTGHWWEELYTEIEWEDGRVEAYNKKDKRLEEIRKNHTCVREYYIES